MLRQLAIIASIGALAGCRTHAEPKPVIAQQVPVKLAAPGHLPLDARILLSDRMQQHGYELTNLMWAMLFLENGEVAGRADWIASSSWIADPSAAEDRALMESLPQRFFDLQNDLVERARVVAKIARAEPQDSAALVQAFGNLYETCVRCHSIYLYGDEDSESLAGGR